MTRRLAAALFLAGMAFAAPAAAVGRGPVPRSISAPDEIIIKSQPFHIVSTVNTRFTLQFPAAVTQDSTIEFLLQRRVANRDSFRAIADRFAEPGVIDTVALPMRRGVASGSFVSFDVLVTTGKSSGNDLNIAQAGIYPVAIRAVAKDGSVTASALTFLDRRDPAVVSVATPVSVLGILRAPVSHTTDGTVAIDDQTRALVGQFVEFLGGTRSPVTLQVQPELVQAFATSPEALDNQMYEQLRKALTGRSIINATYLPVDAAALVHDGLASEIAAQLRLGEATLAQWLPGSTVHRNTWVADSQVDTATVAALRSAGLKTVILMADASAGLERQAPGAVLARPAGPVSTALGILSVDDQLASTIDNAGNDPVRLGARIAAEVMMSRDDTTAVARVPGQVRMIVSSSTGDVLDGPSMVQALSFLASAPGISVQDLGGVANADDATPVVKLPADAGRSLDVLRDAIVLSRAELNAIGSMLPENEPRRTVWAGSLAAAFSPDTPGPSEYVDALRSDMRRVTGSVSLVTPSSIAFSSRTGSIRLQIRNDADIPLAVRVRVASPKVSFDRPAEATQLLPGATTEVAVPIRVRSNGRFSVTVRVLTPTGAVQVVSPRQIEVRVTSVAGLGQLVSVTLLLVLLAWWWSHWRRTHRQADEESTVANQ